MTPFETSAGVGTEGKGSDTKNAVSDSDQETVWVSATGKKTTLLWLKPGQSFCPCGLAQHLGFWAFYGVNDSAACGDSRNLVLLVWMGIHTWEGTYQPGIIYFGILVF